MERCAIKLIYLIWKVHYVSDYMYKKTSEYINGLHNIEMLRSPVMYLKVFYI